MNNHDLPEGFKMTELGPLPEEWEVVRLGSVASVGPRRGPHRAQGLIPFVSMALLPEWGADVENWELRPPERVRSGVVVHEGDLLLAKITPSFENGKQGIVRKIPGGWGYATTEVIPIRTSERLVTEFLNYYLTLPTVRTDLAAKMEGTTGRQRLSKAVLLALHLPLPPLPEQRAIAHVLRTVQRAKEATEKVIAATRELKKSLMRHLFTYGPVPVDQVDQVRLKETAIGPVPEHWEVVRLGEVVDVKGGKRLPKGHSFSDTPTQHPYIRVVDFADGSITSSNLKFLTSDDFAVLQRYTISSEDVYISIAGTIGLVGTVPEELDGANLTENAAKLVIRNKTKILRDFLKAALSCNEQQRQISALATKTSQPKLALARVKQLYIPLPPLPEQRAIAEILRAVDRKLEAEERRKAALEAVFKTLLHHLMTGKIRLPRPLIAQFDQEAHHVL